MTFTLSVSITDEQQTFLKDNVDLSPSKMLQSKIMEIQDNRKVYSQEKYKLEQCNRKLSELLQEANEKLDQLQAEVKK